MCPPLLCSGLGSTSGQAHPLQDFYVFVVMTHFRTKPCTHYDGPTGVPSVHALVAQIQNERGCAVKESEHTNTHKELSRRRVVALQEGVAEPSAVTQRYFVPRSMQPNENKHQHICRSVLLLHLCQVMKKNVSPASISYPRKAKRGNMTDLRD